MNEIKIELRFIHDQWNEARRSPFLQKDVGQWLEQRIGHKEETESGIVHATRHVVEISLKAIDLSITNVGSVKKGQQIEHTEL